MSNASSKSKPARAYSIFYAVVDLTFLIFNIYFTCENSKIWFSFLEIECMWELKASIIKRTYFK